MMAESIVWLACIAAGCSALAYALLAWMGG